MPTHYLNVTRQAIPLGVSDQSKEFNLVTFEILRDEIVKLVQVGGRLESSLVTACIYLSEK